MSKKIAIELSPAAQDRIVTIGYDPAYGARPLKRAIRRELQNPIATMILDNTFSAGDKIVVDCVEEKLIFNKETPPIVIEAATAQTENLTKKAVANTKQLNPKSDEKPEAVSSER